MATEKLPSHSNLDVNKFCGKKVNILASNYIFPLWDTSSFVRRHIRSDPRIIRFRFITIFIPWNFSQFNLIDTPNHLATSISFLKILFAYGLWVHRIHICMDRISVRILASSLFKKKKKLVFPSFGRDAWNLKLTKRPKSTDQFRMNVLSKILSLSAISHSLSKCAWPFNEMPLVR